MEELYPIQNMQYILPGLGNDGAFYDATKSHEWNTEGPSLGMRQYTSFHDTFSDIDLIEDILSQNEDYSVINPNTKVRVTTAYWKSQRLIGHVTKIDEIGFVTDLIVDENYKVTAYYEVESERKIKETGASITIALNKFDPIGKIYNFGYDAQGIYEYVK